MVVQLGAEGALGGAAVHVANRGAAVWRDPGSRNGEAVLSAEEPRAHPRRRVGGEDAGPQAPLQRELALARRFVGAGACAVCAGLGKPAIRRAGHGRCQPPVPVPWWLLAVSKCRWALATSSPPPAWPAKEPRGPSRLAKAPRGCKFYCNPA